MSVTLFSLEMDNIVKTLSLGVDCSLYVGGFLICYRSRNVHAVERQLQQGLSDIRELAARGGFEFSRSGTVYVRICAFLSVRRGT